MPAFLLAHRGQDRLNAVQRAKEIDVELVERVLGVCELDSAGDAETDVKKIADYICESNDNDGIANTLDKFVLKQ